MYMSMRTFPITLHLGDLEPWVLQPHAVQVFCTRVEQVSVDEIITYYLKIIGSKFLQNVRKVWPMYKLDVQFNCYFECGRPT